jgi:hypothetical protein
MFKLLFYSNQKKVILMCLKSVKIYLNINQIIFYNNILLILKDKKI